MTPTPRLEDYMRICTRCEINKHLSEFHTKEKSICIECRRFKCRESKKKTEVKNVVPQSHCFNAYQRKFHDKLRGL